MPRGSSAAGLGWLYNASKAPEMTNAYSAALSLNALRNTWLNLYSKSSPRSRNSTGIDNVSINDFTADHKNHLIRLARRLRHREFQFSALRPHLIKKSNGKDRLICVPTVQDRIIQRALLDFLELRYSDRLANKVSYGFVRKRGVKLAVHDACELRKKYPWVYKTDITSFFDSIDRADLERALKRSIRESSLYPILAEAIHCEIDSVNGSAKKRIAALGIRPDRGVRQGMPLSPFLSNLMLAQFDKEIERRSLHAVRYADDLIFLASSRHECEQLAIFCTEQLAPIGLTVPPVGLEKESKSVIYEPGEPAEFLGVSLVPAADEYRLELTAKQIHGIRDELLGLGSIPELLARRITLAKLGSTLASRTHGYLAAYDMCHNVDSLERALEELQQKVLKKIYVDELKINIAGLNREARTFLGLR
ncbi:reverse transcriptase (RNA-dependent DNA polymerase) [Burkholderia sp. JKS000303]|nr:reverse transcriptase (RNA-dependent DNA polymerase) [Burkholderia sp. JKS000303]